MKVIKLTVNGKKHELLINEHDRLAKVIREKIMYVHSNPVEVGLVEKPEDYVFSSARDYNDEKGLVKNVVIADLWLAE